VIRAFQIGMNRCGSTSIHAWFRRCGWPSVHWGGGGIALEMAERGANGLPLIRDDHPARAFSDMESVTRAHAVFAWEWYEQLAAENPGAWFVLNTRPLADWMRSRLRHDGGRYARLLTLHGRPPETWAEERERHHDAVRRFFATAPNGCRLVEVDITAADAAERLSVITGRAVPFPHRNAYRGSR
jgi:hypothetical protein